MKSKLRDLGQWMFWAALTWPVSGWATIVEMQTSLGNIQIQLYDTLTPKTVANFLTYVKSGAYNDSFIHRSVPGFVIQGGGYDWINGKLVQIKTQPAVVNEFAASNVRGTIAMAKVSGNVNSATDQWFFNLADNSSNLDNQNGGFTAFGRVVGNGMAVADDIAALKVYNACSTSNTSCDFSNLPLRSKQLISAKNLVMINHVKVLAGVELTDNQMFDISVTPLPFIVSEPSKMLGLMLTNTQAKALTVNFAKDAATVLNVTVQANSTLSVPFPSGFSLAPSDTFIATVLNANNSNNTLGEIYVQFQLKH